MRIFYFLTALIFLSQTSFGQTSGFSGTGANINVDNYQIWWRVNPDTVDGSNAALPWIKGVVKIKFKTTVSNVSTVSFDLNSVLVIDQVQRGATVLAAPARSGNIFTISLGTTLAAIGTRDSVTITYHGSPPLPLPSVTGFTLATNVNAGNYVNTLSESYEDRDWWPCKADMQDKADTVDITVNVPWKQKSATDTFWVASNGTLIDSTINSVDKSRSFKYINRYPMASYLVCLGVARYTRFYQGTIPIGGFNVPVVYYIIAGKSTTAIITAMDKATEALAKFSIKFGDYGFVDPVRGGKHGYYEGLTGATAMEHQTFTAMSSGALTSQSTLIHELAHQWFGDKVSFSTWNDLWLAEAFATYSQVLAPQLVTGMSYSAFSERSAIKTTALSQLAPAYIPNSGIINSDNIWNGTGALDYGSAVYQRGAMVISMLREMSGDTKFFNVLKEYQTRSTLQYKSATYDTLKQIFSDSLGANLTQFFMDNIKKTGYPKNDVSYKQLHGPYDSIYLKVKTQTTANPTLGSFQQPVIVHLKKTTAPVKDTTIIFFDWRGKVSKAGSGVLGPQLDSVGYKLSFRPDTYLVDDSAKTLSSTNTITGVDVLGTTVLDLKVMDFTVKPHAGYNTAALTLDDNSTNAEVILERATDAINFKELGNMALQAGNIGNTKRYSLNDAQPLQTDNYYRAKFKNTDAVFIYSAVVKIAAFKTGNFYIINNPVSDVLQIKTDIKALNTAFALSIADAQGKIIFTKQISNAGSITEIDASGFAPGIYILKIVNTNNEIQNITFIKK